MNLSELDDFYVRNYSIGYLNPVGDENHSSFEKKLILISLICYITYKTKLKNPDVTHYQVISKLSQNLGLPDEFIKGLSIICKDFSYGCSDFPTFGLKGNDIVKEVREILRTYLPF